MLSLIRISRRKCVYFPKIRTGEIAFSYDKMKNQTISTFFRPSTKRQPEEMLSSASKRQCADGPENCGSPNIKLSTDQQRKMEENKLKAKIRLQSKKTPALSPNISPEWFKALEKNFEMEYFRDLSAFIKKERENYTIYPPEDLVYSWTQMCEIWKIKVVILGQDPYHEPRQAHGLAFSVVKGVTIPPSLKNMYTELATDISGFVAPDHGDLSGWAKQGVLLLNACLTVRANQANSHKERGWENLTDAVIKWINDNCSGVAFLLWGRYAQRKGAVIDKKKHLVLECAHPSPLSASRGFFGSQHFSKANSYLKTKCKEPIDWTAL